MGKDLMGKRADGAESRDNRIPKFPEGLSGVERRPIFSIKECDGETPEIKGWVLDFRGHWRYILRHDNRIYKGGADYDSTFEQLVTRLGAQETRYWH